MAGLPPLEAFKRGLLLEGPRNLDQWMHGHAPGARRLHARRLTGLFPVLRRPRRIAESLALVTRREVDQQIERTGASIDVRVRIADRREARRHGLHGEVGRVAP